jgi:putative aldouronate transport system substrate-binding protein
MAEEAATPRISEETITLTVAGPSGAKAEDWESTIQFQEYEKRLGIKFDATTYTDEQWGSKFTLMLASDEMPDLVSMSQVPMSRADLEKYVADGYFLDFSKYLDIMPNLVEKMEKFPEYKDAVTASDGGIYGFTFLNSRDPGAKLIPIYMSQKWLDNVGMERPATLEELYEVLKAFKEQDANGNGDPNDEIPMGMSCSTTASWQNELPILWAYGINSDIYSYHRKGNEDGTVALWDIRKIIKNS